MRWPEGPPHLALNPFFNFLFFCFCFFGGFKGQVRGSGEVARRATSLGPKPSLFSLFVFLFVFFGFAFFSLLVIDKKTCFCP